MISDGVGLSDIQAKAGLTTKGVGAAVVRAMRAFKARTLECAIGRGLRSGVIQHG